MEGVKSVKIIRENPGSTITIIILLTILLAVILATIFFLAFGPLLINSKEPIQQQSIILIKTIAETPKPNCVYPNLQIGNTCCLDNNRNGVCDNEETTIAGKTSCSMGYIKEGYSCCLDDNDNGLCDIYEHHYYRYYNDFCDDSHNNSISCHRYYSDYFYRYADYCDSHGNCYYSHHNYY